MEDHSILRQLCQAIELRAEVTLGLDGVSGPEIRKCQPHMVYESSTGRILLEAYQKSGVSTRRLPSWKSLEVDSIKSVQIEKSTFMPAPGWRPENRERYVRPICSVEV